MKNHSSRFLLAASSWFLVFTLLLAACGGTAPSPSSSKQSSTFVTQADAFLSQEVSNHTFSGVVLVTQNGKMLLNKGYSVATWEPQVPNTPSTKFRIASVTKQFTALAILMLQEEGKLHVQDHVCAYIAHCPNAWQPITLQHLLTHTSGLPKLSLPPQTLPTSPEAILARYNDLPLDFPPGTKYQYRNENYQFLGYIIQQVSGESYASFIQQRILAPLHMSNTGFTLTSSSQLAEALALGYTTWQQQAGPFDLDAPIPADMTFLYAAYYLYSTTEDLQRWDQALFTHTLVSQSSLDAMFTPYVSTCPAQGCPNPYTTEDYGYGWNISKEANLRVFIWHGGEESGFTSLNGFYPASQVSIIVLSNLATVQPWQVAYKFENMLFGTT